ncbi:Fur family transcriptional regulator [Boudabousia marimammalium]|uniref:Transcriptional repressor n=1 Tax=Boudabousia marimammalium TaxID=156892 RepID=A0A1Q5PP71_9ACTO|nr:Fur family transcriptional regulator [Boudabousia marimammalium]OKL49313.1 transcriptional repressor [Boudabousia marimammalium]
MQRMTRQRAAIEQLLSELDEFRSAQQLHDDLRKSGNTIGLATVYRTLQQMAEAKEVDVVRGADGEALYRRCTGWEHHHHLICRECNKAVEISSKIVERWVHEVANQHDFTEVQHAADMIGLCKECAAKKKA